MNSEHVRNEILKAQTFQRAGRFQDAIAICSQVLKAVPRDLNATYLMAMVQAQAGDIAQAASFFEATLAIKPDFTDARFNLAYALNLLGRHEAAIPLYAEILRVNHRHPGARLNYSNCLKETGRYSEALASYDELLRLLPQSAEAHSNRALVLEKLRRLDEALVGYDKAISLKPDYVEAHSNKGVALQKLRRFDEAIACYERALALKPDFAEAYANLGNIFRDMKRYEEASSRYDSALALKPDYDYLLGAFAHTCMLMCDWRRFEEHLLRLEQAVLANRKASDPFSFLSLHDSSALQASVARRFARDMFPDDAMLGPIARRPVAHDKIRLGYFSADLHDHATAYLMAEMFERHDRDRFEVIAFSFGPDSDDAMRERLKGAFDQFLDVRFQSDREIAQLAREMEIDIAIDLKGYNGDSRPQIFAARCAPVQVNYLGYPGTMGAPYMDYIVADRVLIPPQSQSHYHERVVYLPGSYQVNDTRRQISDRIFTREEVGLPPEGFVFCCFNKNYKITPTTFDSWMRILTQVEGGLLWLLEDSPVVSRNLRREAELRGVDGARLIFAKRMALPDHLARHRLAGLFLDTLPYNAHTTASDALWAGLPVLTQIGEAFAGRVAASLLTAVGLPELIATSTSDYEARAIRLAREPEALAQIQRRLADTRVTSQLFDTKLFVRHMEAAYGVMHERHRAGLGPEHILVDP